MAVSGEFTSLHEALEVVGAEGFEGIGKALQILMNTAMHLERQKYLNASDYERTEGRRGYANGYKPKTVKTRVGEVELRVPQTRDGGFFPSCLTKGPRSSMWSYQTSR